ncbi:hypothetical protein DH2020_000097 [Rehmannia glutinosa]|uniref:NOT2/NOT3/NOT5 C-terminal domain-containing protein n=1 Tax=Rehmannia glutinosa TaxID=99300 RepID=A0ABR0XVH9_REHGL
MKCLALPLVLVVYLFLFLFCPSTTYAFSHLELSSLNGSSSSLPDSTGRSFSSSFSAQSGAGSPVYHHTGELFVGRITVFFFYISVIVSVVLTGNMQGLHNIHGNFNVPNMPGALGSRSTTMNNIPSSGVPQAGGNLSSGRFASNNLPVALSQISHSGAHVHSGMASRGGLGVNPVLGNSGPRITSSVGNIVGGGNIGRNISTGGGLSVPGLTSRLNLTANSGSGNINVQGQNRLMGGVLQQASPQVLSMLGNSYPSAGGPLSQNHVQPVNNLTSLGMLNDMNSNDGAPFDINDFPQLTSRPNSSEALKDNWVQCGNKVLALSFNKVKSSACKMKIFQPYLDLKIEGGRGNSDYPMDLHQKEQLHDSSVSMMQQPQHFSMGRSAGFNLGAIYSSQRPQQQQPHTPSASGGGPFSNVNNQDLLHLHGSEMFPSSHSSFHSQGKYDQVLQQYQQHQNQSQFRLQQMSAVGQSFRDQGVKPVQAGQAASDPFGLRGLLSVIRMSDPDLTSLALGIDLTTLGLNLNSSENLHKAFGSPWSDEPAKGDPEYNVPQSVFLLKCVDLAAASILLKVPTGHTVLYFLQYAKDEAQLYAANELYNRGWFYHREHGCGLREFLTRSLL